ncbi:UvrD-helicase domain-containing protein [Helicobacter sp. T3_23-1059]
MISHDLNTTKHSTQIPQNTQNPLAHCFLALKASAGSGKTFSLALRYIWLLFSGAKPSEILALTFTNKATKEMQERVKNALKELANPITNETSPFINALQNLGLSKQEIRAKSHKIYKEFLDSTPKICTIDSFFNLILHKFCWYVGLSQDYKIGENIDENELFEAFLATLEKNYAKSTQILNSNTSFQNLPHAKAQNLSNTQNLSNAFSHLVRFCFDFDIDFTSVMRHLQAWHNDKIHFNEAFLSELKSYSLDEIKSQIKQCESSILSTLKSMQEILQKGEVTDKGINALQASNMAEFIKKEWTFLGKDEPNEYKYFKKPLKNENLNAEFRPLFFELKENLKQYFLLKERVIFAEFAMILEAFGKAQNATLQASKKLSFESCALKVYELLILGENLHKDTGGIDPQFFYFRMDNAISHILIDEFQDTNPMQYAILEPLIDEIYAGKGRDIKNLADNSENNRSVFFVGDSKQCIYGFRGSEARFFDEIIAHSPLHTHNLPHNYRSQKTIIDFVNACFAQIFGDEKYQNQSLPNPTQNAQNKNTSPKSFVCVVQETPLIKSTSTESKKEFSQNDFSEDFNAESMLDFSQNSKSQNPQNKTQNDAQNELLNETQNEAQNEIIKKVLDSIQTLLMLNINPNDIAILCFRNDDIFSINEAIKQRFGDIKTTPEIKSAFIQKPSVRFILSALKFLDMQSRNNATNNEQTPRDKSLQKTSDFYIYECLKIAGKSAFDMSKEKRENLVESFKSILIECLKKSTNTKDFNNQKDAQVASEMALETPLKEVIYKPSKCILEIIKSFQICDKNAQKLIEISLEKKSENLSEFIARAESQSITSPKENQVGLRILTIHGAKGLEFPYIILADRLGGESTNHKQFIYDKAVYFAMNQKQRRIVDSEFASALESSKKLEEIEKQNVLYVACTRAKNGLIIAPKSDRFKTSEKEGTSKSAFSPILEAIETPFFAEHFGSLSTLQQLQQIATQNPNPLPQSTQNQTSAKPKILSQKSFGAQTQTLKNALPKNMSPNAKNMRFGEALHLVLEYALGFGTKKEILASLLQNHFGAQIDIVHILMLVEKTKKQLDDFLQKQILQEQDLQKQIYVEIPLFFDGELKRIDLLAQCENKIFILDYKSGINSKEEHKKQVNGYIDALKTLYKDYEINGYVAYIRDEMVWEKC